MFRCTWECPSTSPVREFYTVLCSRTWICCKTLNHMQSSGRRPEEWLWGPLGVFDGLWPLLRHDCPTVVDVHSLCLMWTRGFAITPPKTHLLPIVFILLSLPVYFSFDLMLLDSSATFILPQVLSCGLAHSLNSHQVAYSEGWTLVVTDGQLFLCTLCWRGQSPSVILKMFEPITISVSHMMSIFAYAFAGLWTASKTLRKFSAESVRIFYSCARFFFFT